MSNIPSDIYDRVHELALAITNASEAGDDVVHDSSYQTLRTYFDEQTRLGRSPPFLTEALADYTYAPDAAIRYYELALQQTRTLPDEPTHTKMISLAQRLVEVGRREEAEAFLRDGRAEAVRRSDAFSPRTPAPPPGYRVSAHPACR